MKHVWSPWRLEYLTSDREDGCVFCRAATGSDDRQNLVLLRGERVFLILNRYPYNNGHFMVVPYEHVSSLIELDTETLAEMMLILNHGLDALQKTMAPNGFNIGVNIGEAAGAGIQDHVHMHVVPRWTGDTNFMPVVGETRVVPQTWMQTYDLLKAALEDRGGLHGRLESEL